MKQRRFSISARCWAVVLTLAMLLGMMPMMARAAENATASAAVNKVVDPSTVNTYQDLLGAFADGNRYAGRIWTDKSVFSDNAALSQALGNELSSAQLQQLNISPEEFLVIYSALGSTTSVATETVVSSNLDVVIVLDNSGSMDGIVQNAQGQRVTRLRAVVDAANELIHSILENPSTRLAVVSYADDADVLLELDSYAQTANCLSDSNGLRARADSLTDNSDALQGNSVSGNQTGTNIQAGINEAMRILNNAVDTQNRTPVVIVMTDGEANYAAYQDMLGDTSGDGNYKQPSSSNTTADLALSTLLNAAYWKYTVGQKYGTAAKVYTVGVDVEEMDDAALILNPAVFFLAESTRGFTNVAVDTLELYAEWAESSEAVYGTSYGSSSNRPGNRPGNRYTFTFPQPGSAQLKEGIEQNIIYADAYYEVNSAKLQEVFDDILIRISSLQDAFQAIEKSDITKGESSMAYVDFLGDYMELKHFNGISLYGEFYTVVLHSVTSAANDDGTVTATYTYKVQDNGQPIAEGVRAEGFLLSENVLIELKHTYAVDAQGNRASAGEQDLWIHMDEQVLPLIYHKVKTENGVTTYTVYEQMPVRFYYSVGISSYVAPAGNVLTHRMDAEYLADNTDENGVVYFYANQYYAQDDDEHLVNHTMESGYGDAHNAITPDNSNRYYIHQYNYPIYAGIQDANGNAVVMDPDTYGVPYDSNYATQVLTYADLEALNESTKLYSLVTFHAPTGNQQGTSEDGGKVYNGTAKAYYVFTQWGHLLDDVVFYDSVHGVYINADGSVSETKGVWNENYTYSQYLAAVEAYLNATNGVTAEDLQAYLAIGSWRIPRFANRTFAKESNPTNTASLRIAPVLDSADATEHEGSIVAWLGNNGRIGYTAQESKTVTNSAGQDLNGQLVLIGEVLTYTITATNYEDAPATIVITDQVPAGTAYVSDSADNNGVYENGKLTWNLANVAVGATVQVSYQVEVTGENMGIIENTAYITIGNNPTYETNTTKNPPVGKVSSSDRYTASGEVQVGDILTYTIYYHNNTSDTTAITISDTIPTGTHYVEGSASYSGTNTLALTTDSDGIVTGMKWVIAQVPAGQSGSVHFQVRISADAVNPIANTAQIQVGDNNPIISTNPVEDDLAYGALSLSKLVTAGNASGNAEQYFTLVLQSGIEGVSVLNGTFQVTGSSKHEAITFNGGVAELQIKHGETILVQDLPAGITVSVYEKDTAGYSPVYSSDAVSIIANETVAVEITNVYNVAPTSLALNGKKILNGAQLQANAFSFLVLDANGDVVAGGSNDASGNIPFNSITYASAGVYTYTVKEVNAGANGITYDATEYTVTVTVVDNGDGTLSASAAYPEGGLVFTNTYKPVGTSVTPQATKILSGRELAAGEFSFVIKDTSGNVVSYGNMDAQGNITFGAIYLDAAGTYNYTMEEVVGNLGGVHYDTASYAFTVKVVDDGVGQLVAEVEYPNGGIIFRNTYAPKAVSLRPTAVKVLDGKKMAGGEFTFVLEDEAGNVVATATNDATGAVVFAEISYTQPGSYRYRLYERLGDDLRYTYDTAVYEAAVVVTDDGEGNLYASYHIYRDQVEVGAATFYNHYTPEAISLDLNDRISITKTVVDAAQTGISPEGFEFRVYNWNGDLVSSGTSDHNGNIDLVDVLMFAEAGEYHFRIVEVSGDANGVHYDRTVWLVTVTVTYNPESGLLAVDNVTYGPENSTGTSSGVIQFQNTYAPVDAQVSIQMNKTLNGRELVEGEFLFWLLENGEVVAEARNDADGNVTFAMTYQKVGTYTYTVVEVAGALGGVIYDDSVHTVQVTVTDNRAEGKLEAVAVITEGDGNFVNEYKPTDTAAIVTARKLMSGRELAPGEFTFLLEDANGNILQAKNAADGTITFPAMVYDAVGTYVYTLYEQAGDLGGVTYSSRVYTVTISVVDDLEGNLVATVAYTFVDSNGVAQPIAEPLFRNIYAAEAVSLQISAEKTLAGRELAAGEFTFLLSDEEGNAWMAVNAADGSVIFDELVFAEAGTYLFTITEQAGELGGVTYSDRVYIATVVVTDDGYGQLEAEVIYTYNDEVVELPLFVNVYQSAGVTLELEAAKMLSGRELVEGEFAFQLVDENGNALEATNAADGTIRFQNLEYNQAGMYTYTLSEVVGDVDTVIYDETVYTIVVVVEDDGNGQLQIASVTVNGAEVAVSELVAQTEILFVNVYDRLPATGDRGIGRAVVAMTASLVALVVLLLVANKRRNRA